MNPNESPDLIVKSAFAFASKLLTNTGIKIDKIEGPYVGADGNAIWIIDLNKAPPLADK